MAGLSRAPGGDETIYLDIWACGAGDPPCVTGWIAVEARRRRTTSLADSKIRKNESITTLVDVLSWPSQTTSFNCLLCEHVERPALRRWRALPFVDHVRWIRRLRIRTEWYVVRPRPHHAAPVAYGVL